MGKKYFVSGCIEDGNGNVERVEDNLANFFGVIN